MEGPLVPGRPTMVILHQHAKHGVIRNPGIVVRKKRTECIGAAGVFGPVTTLEGLERGAEQILFELFDLGVADRTMA